MPVLPQRMLTKPTNVPSKEDFNKRMLLVHNKLRALVARGGAYPQPAASNMNKLQHSSVLESIAEIWANSLCNISKAKREWDMSNNNNREELFQEMMTDQVQNHTFQVDFSKQDNRAVGENIAIFNGKANHANMGAELDRFEYMVTAWFNEHDYSVNDAMTRTASYRYIEGHEGKMYPPGTAVHYTAVVGATTRYLGCGWNFCQFGQSTHRMYEESYNLYLVCNYYPSGNWKGKPPYLKGTQCSHCESDRGNRCSASDSDVGAGLCDGCMATDKYAGGGNILATCNAAAQEEHALAYNWSSALPLLQHTGAPTTRTPTTSASTEIVSPFLSLATSSATSIESSEKTIISDAIRNVVDFSVDCKDLDRCGQLAAMMERELFP